MGIALCMGLTSSWVASAAADTKPPLDAFFTVMQPKSIAPEYEPLFIEPFTADLNGDGNDDLVVLAAAWTGDASGFNIPLPGLLFLGDGNGGFSRAPAALFPVDTLKMVNPRKALFADFNGDGRLDMFVASTGWDADPYPGEQSRLFLSRPDGGWRDATAELPQLSAYSHGASFGDIRGRGTTDIVVHNYFAPPPNHVLSYALLNDGAGHFVLSRDVIPVATGQTMNTDSGNYSPGVTLVDLDGDGLPDLVVFGDTTDDSKKLRHTTVLWNRSGVFSEANKTALPEPAVPTHFELDAQAIDMNGDGLADLVIIGSRGRPFYDGWFVQLLLNRGDGTFADVTADRLEPGDRSGGTGGYPSGSILYPVWVKVLDFNGDGFPDFAVEYNVPPNYPAGQGLPRSTPLIYLNDGTGHFSTLKVGDFVKPGDETALGGGHLMATRHGYSFITLQTSPFLPRKGLVLTGLLASQPFRVRRPEPPAAFDVKSSGPSVALTWFAPGAGSTPSEYVIEAGSAPGLSDLANVRTGTPSTAFFASAVGAGRYYVRVRSSNIAGVSTPSNEVLHVVGAAVDGCSAPPATPTLSASASGSTVSLSWSTPPGAASYVVEAGSATGQSDIASVNVGATPSLTANGVGAGTYHVRVLATNSCGTGAPSIEAVVTVR